MFVDINPKGHRNHLLFGLGGKRNTIGINLSTNPHVQRQNEEYIPLMKMSSSQGKPVAIGKPATGTVAVTYPCKHTAYGSSLLPPTPYE